MRRVPHTSRLMIAAMLVLAVTLVWPSSGPMASKSHAHMNGAEASMVQDHSAHRAPAHGDCQPSGIGCCMMTLCHPGMAIDPYDMAFERMSDETEAVPSAEAPGSEPEVDVPPPRVLLG